MEYLALEIFNLSDNGSKYATLPEDASFTITKTSQIFGSGDVWSHSFALNIPANAHIFGTAGDMHGARLHEQIDHRRARLWACGLPMYLGYLKLANEAEVDADGNVDVTFESGKKTFEEMIEGGKANQVPMMSDVMFGVALWRKRRVKYGLKIQASAVYTSGGTTGSSTVHANEGEEDESSVIVFTGDGEDEPIQEYPRMVFPKGDFKNLTTGENSFHVDCINTDYPYTEDENGTPTHPYCNIALCYQRSGYEKKDDLGVIRNDYSSEPEAQRGYEVMPANRVNSAPNFFVIYWIRALMKHLGIHIDENQMMDVEDLRRLFFVNTKCAYKEPGCVRGEIPDPQFTRYKFGDEGRLVAEQFGPKENDYRGIPGHMNMAKLVKTSECGFTCADGYHVEMTDYTYGTVTPPTIDKIVFKVTNVAGMSDADKGSYESDNSFLHDAYATSECFPDVDISEAIKAIENGFGVRFVFNENYDRVRIVLLRNIFRNKRVQEIRCDILSEEKAENNIRGFRMTYGDSEDTHFYYKGFADLLPHKNTLWPDNSDTHDYSQWDLNAEYQDVIHKVSAFNKTCYVTPNTGNAYIVKVDKDAKRYEDLHQSLFGCADFMDAEDGDCTGEEDTIETINAGFSPAIMNDLNFEQERNDGESNQRFALFVDEKMRPRRPDLMNGTDYNDPDAVYNVDGILYNENLFPAGKEMKHDGIVKPGEFAITSDMHATKNGLSVTLRHRLLLFKWEITGLNIDGHINEGYRLYLQDNFEPNDLGVSPIETHEWGLTLGIMRGSGSDSYVRYEDDPQDGEGNDTWDVVPGSNATAHPDTCDSYGNGWGYVTYMDKTGQQLAEELLEGVGINPSFASRWRYANPDTVEIEGYGYPHPSGKWGGWPEIFCQDGVFIGGRQVMVTPIRTDGTILLYDQYQAYVAGLQSAYESTDGSLSFDDRMQAVKSSDSLDLLVSWTGFYPNDTFYLIWSYALDFWDSHPPMEDGKISLKLRAEKPNPYFDPSVPENSTTNRRYLKITNEALQGRGLADQFYKAYSKFVREARISKQTASMELAQLLSIDMTEWAHVGDVTGLIKTMQFTISNKTGLGNVTMDVMYI